MTASPPPTRTSTGRTDLPPLYRSVDPEAMKSLLGGSPDAVVRFPYCDRLVEVSGVGRIVVHDSLDGADPVL